jgi:4-hydroxy-tetrahydrodipicolinate reductase
VSEKHPIALAGACGRMGSAVERALASAPDLSLVFRADRSLTLGPLTGPDLSSLAPRSVAGIIDFTSGAGAAEAAGHATRIGCALVSGSTGLDDAGRAALHTAAETVAVCWSPNFSVGIPFLTRALREAARKLPQGWQIEISEVHHCGKRDAPSGTALRLADAWKEERGGRAVYGRQGIVGPRESDEIGIHALRIGDVVGEHRVLLGVAGETIEAIHRVQDRTAFAGGCLEALRRLLRQGPGWYGWEDLLCGD